MPLFIGESMQRLAFDVDVEREALRFCSCKGPLTFWSFGFEYILNGERWFRDDATIVHHSVQGLTVLHIAAIFGMDKLAQEVSMHGNWNPNVPDSMGRTPLRLAAAH